MGDRGFFTDNIRVKDTTTPTKEFLISMATANGLPPPSQDDLEKITERYQNTYIAQMKRQYGFTDNTMMQLHSEFQIQVCIIGIPSSGFPSPPTKRFDDSSF